VEKSVKTIDAHLDRSARWVNTQILSFKNGRSNAKWWGSVQHNDQAGFRGSVWLKHRY
jgi:hypothetical protein